MRKQIVFYLLLLLLTLQSTHAQDLKSLPVTLEPISAYNANRIQEIIRVQTSLETILQVRWSPNGTQLAVLGEIENQSIVEIWTIVDNQLPETPTVEFSPQIADTIAWLPDGRTLVTQGGQYRDDQAYFSAIKWDTSTGQEIETLLQSQMERPVSWKYEDDVFYDLVIPPILAWNRTYTQTAVSEGNLAIQFSDGYRFHVDYGKRGRAHHIQWSPDDNLVAVIYGGDDTYQIAILDAQTANPILTAFGEDYFVSEIEWSPDSLTLAVASIWANPFSPNVNIRFYRIGEPVVYGNGEVILSGDIPEESKQRSASLAWSPDSGIIGISFPSIISFYEAKTFSEIGSLDESEIVSIDWNSSGEIVVGGGTDGILHLWGVSPA